MIRPRATTTPEPVDIALECIQAIVRYPRAPTPRETLFLAATFDHEMLPESLHRRLLRRWNAFNVVVQNWSEELKRRVLGELSAFTAGRLEACAMSASSDR